MTTRFTVSMLTVMSVGAGLCVIGEARAESLRGARGDRVVRMRDLNLTCAQEANIAAIREEYGDKVDEAADEVGDLIKKEIKEIREVLTPEQKAKLADIRDEAGERRAEGVAQRLAHLRELRPTDAERGEIAEIRKEYRPKIAKVLERLKDTLSAEQMERRERALDAGKSRRDVLASLNLTDSQESEVESVGRDLRALVREELEKVRDVLGADQQERLSESREEARARIRDRFAAAVVEFKELNLTDQQKSQIEAIRNEYRPKLREAGNDLRAAIRGELEAVVAVLRESTPRETLSQTSGERLIGSPCGDPCNR